MILHARLILALGATLTLACGDNGGGETTAAPTTTTVDPSTTTTGETTGTPTTTGAESSSSSGEPAHSCLVYTDEATCKDDAQCQWKGVVQHEYGAQGCQGSITELCIEREPTGGASAWYRELGQDTQVVEFAYTPQNLDPSWLPCTCDGPLACLCSSVTEDCPDRLDEFCGGITTNMGCGLANIRGTARCSWLTLSAEGPPDMMCADSAYQIQCMPADNADAVTCTAPAYSFEPCIGFNQEVFWRDNAGIIELIATCGPQPLGFTRCEADDTAEQPDDCKCRCL